MPKKTKKELEAEMSFTEVELKLRTRDYELRRVRLKRYKGPGRPPNIFPIFSRSPEAKKLYKWFFKKLIDHIPKEIDFMRRLEILFLSNQRRVALAYCVNEVKMPGLLIQEDGTFRPPTTREQSFSRGSPIFIRLDATMPDRIDIEKAQFPGIVFVLTRAEYYGILHNLEEITKCSKLLDPATLMKKL